MNMQAFYKKLSVKPLQAYQRRLVNLTHISRTQILDATQELTWLVWGAEQTGT